MKTKNKAKNILIFCIKSKYEIQEKVYNVYNVLLYRV